MGGIISKETALSYVEQERIIRSATEVARLLNQTWPQFTDAGLHYAIAGSLSVALLAGAGSYTDTDGTNFFLPAEVLNKIKSSLHEIHDIDIENRFGPFPHVLTEKSDLFLDQVAKLMSEKCAKLDDPDSIGVKAPAVAVDIAEERFFITRFDYQVGLKILGVFANYDKKPLQLNHEVPLLLESAVLLYGEEHMWSLIGSFFDRYDEINYRYQRLGRDLSTDRFFGLVVSDGLVSEELKDLLRKGMAARRKTR